MEINPRSVGYELGVLPRAHREAAVTYRKHCDAPYCGRYVTHWSRRRYLDGRPTGQGSYLCSPHAQAFALRFGLDFDAVGGRLSDPVGFDVLDVADADEDPVTCLDCGRGLAAIDGRFINAMGRCDDCETAYWNGVLASWAAYARKPGLAEPLRAQAWFQEHMQVPTLEQLTQAAS